MKFLFYVSGEHSNLPKSELAAVLAGEEIDYRIEYDKNRLLLIYCSAENFNFITRLAMVKIAAEFVIKSNDLSEAAGAIINKISCNDYKTFAVRCKTLDSQNSMEVERELGKKIKEISNLDVNLKNPEVTISCFKDTGYFAGIQIDTGSNKSINQRKAQNRPYFSPVSIHPKIARVLVNLARIKTGNTVFDPFCGTGGILVEAGLMGMKIIGSDIDERMVCGCIENLKFYGLEGEIRTGDALRLKNIETDAIVTDPPYGRSSFVSEKNKNLKNLIEFYNNFIGSAKQILKKGKFLVMVLPSEYKLNFDGFLVCEFHDVRMHKTLTRRIWVLKRK